MRIAVESPDMTNVQTHAGAMAEENALVTRPADRPQRSG